MSSSYSRDLVARLRAQAMEKMAKEAQASANLNPNFLHATPEGQKVTVPAPSSVVGLRTQIAASANPSSILTHQSVFTPLSGNFQFNAEQMSAIELAMRGRSMCLIGSAGTGKTTTTREIFLQLLRSVHISTISESTKYLRKEQPSIVAVGFTNKAVNNLKRALPSELKSHCITIHKLLEFKPVNHLEAAMGQSGAFVPTYHKGNKLPHISCIIWEESSMISTEQAQWIIDALPHPELTIFIFLGDIYQLPPIFGPSILGFKMAELPYVELVHVYRQALESPIITLAHKVKNAQSIQVSKDEMTVWDNGEHGIVTFKPWKQKAEWDQAVKAAGKMYCSLLDAGKYNPDEDMILCPFNKSFGTIELNKHIANHLAKKRGAVVYEVRARQMVHYFSVGDKVLCDRQEGIITKIEPNRSYEGKATAMPSVNMDYWGMGGEMPDLDQLYSVDDVCSGEEFFDTMMRQSVSEKEEAKNLASHSVWVKLADMDDPIVISKSGDMNKILLAYALTIHKSQGSEWPRVFLALHYSHNTALTRELMYTAMTRARQELHIIGEPGSAGRPNSLTRAADNAEIPGVSLAEKILYFQGKKRNYQVSES